MAKKANGNGKKIADITLAFNLGIVAILFSTQFFEIPNNLVIAIVLLCAGIATIILASREWGKI